MTNITGEMAAAAAEQSGENHVIPIRGEEFTIPGGSLPWAASIEIARFAKEQASSSQADQAGSIVALDDAMRIIFGEDQWHRVTSMQPLMTVNEMMEVVNRVTDLYTGTDVGEARGSAGNSRSSGGRPRPTFNTSTGSISAGPVTEPLQNGQT